MKALKLKESQKFTDQITLLKVKVARQLNLSPDSSVVLGVTSYRPGEGVSSVVMNLAMSFSQGMGTRILVVDAKPNNLARTDLVKTIKTRSVAPPPQQPAASAATEAAEDADQESVPTEATLMKQRTSGQLVHAESNFDVIFVQGKNADSQNYFDVETFKLFLEKARNQYNLILIDSPSIRENNFSSLISTSLDGLVLVVEAGRVRREVLKRAIDDLKAMGANLVGVVLNKRRFPIPEFLYRWI